MPLVPWRMRATRESGPMARCQADCREASSREKRATSGSSVRGSTVATLSGTYSLRPFQATKVRVRPVGSVAPCWTTSTEIGTAAKASAERSRPHGTVTVNGRVWPAGTVGSAVVPTVRPDAGVRPDAQSSSAARWFTVTSPRTTRSSGLDSGPVSGAVTVPVIVTSLPGLTTAGDRVSRTTTATSLTGVTAGRCSSAATDVTAYVVGTPGEGAALATTPPDRQAQGRQRGRGGRQAAHDAGPATPARVRTPRPSKDHAVPASRFHAACAMRRSLGKVSLRCTSSSLIHATSMASWSGSFSMESSPPVASRR